MKKTDYLYHCSMRKYVIFLLAIILLLLGFAYVQLFAKQTSYHQTIAASTSSVLVLENFDNTRVKIVTGDTDEIILNLKGPADDILSIIRAESRIYTELNFSDQPAGIEGTIIVPEGMLIDFTLSGKRNLSINDVDSSKVVSDDSFLVDTKNLSSISVNDSGGLSLDAWGDLTVWDDEEWDPLDGNSDGSEDIVYCGIGSQAIRDYCCETEHADQQNPQCDGLAHWIFNNSERDCQFVCDQEDEETEIIVPIDCGVGSQTERNLCCAQQHIGEYQGCIGSWNYNNASQDCQFVCHQGGSPADPPSDDENGDEEEENFSYGDPVSDFCVDVIDEEDRNLCCDDALKNELSSGPRPGFPDCIGKWNFDVQMGCAFECAEHAEMIEILNQLKQEAQQN